MNFLLFPCVSAPWRHCVSSMPFCYNAIFKKGIFVRVLITGIAGFVGSTLANHLLNDRRRQSQSLAIHGIIHRADWRIRLLRDRLRLHKGDMRNPAWVDQIVETVRPDLVFHLAAWSDVRRSWQQPWAAYELNIGCQLNLLEGLRRHAPAARVIVVASSEVYGLIQPADLPIDEDTPLRPNSPYGISKVAQDLMAQQYWFNFGLPTVRVRSFNHIGPGQSDDFVASAFARQIAEIEAGLQEPIVRVGNLEAERDYTDVRDVIRAYWLAVQHGLPGAVYNVGSGTAYPARQLLDILLELSDVDIAVMQDPNRLRPSDVSRSVCDPRRLTKATGWQPTIDLHQSLADILQFWRGQTQGHRDSVEVRASVGRDPPDVPTV